MSERASLQTPMTPKAEDSGRAWRALRAMVRLACVVAGAIVIAKTRPVLLATFTKAKDKQDLWVLPSPQHSIGMSLGYRSAMADVLFAHVLVSSGLHLQEKRRFETAASYIDIINALDPRFASPYRFADTILTVQATRARLEDYQAARKILERGMAALPHDAELWLTAGQFLAYIAPPRIAELVDEETSKQWRREGAKRLARSCELVGNNEALPYHCVTAARLFSETGERQALMQFVERILAVTDDPQVHEQALASLSRAFGEEQKAEMRRRRERLDAIRKNDLPFVGKDRFLLLGPKVASPFECLGASATGRVDCATSLRDYHERLDKTPQSVP